MGGNVITIAIIIAIIAAVVLATAYLVWRQKYREAKNIERSLKMVPMRIHLPPLSDDISSEGARDSRDITEETISQAQVMYNVIAGTATKGFQSKVFGQRHISFEIVAKGGLIHYYAVVPTVLTDTIRQAVIAAYPTARLEEVEENNVFSEIGKLAGTMGGDFSLKKSYETPLPTYQESKRDAMRAIINALSVAGKEDGVGLQILIRPAKEGWAKSIDKAVDNIRKGKKTVFGQHASSSNWAATIGDVISALWKPPEAHENNSGAEFKQLSGAEQAKIEVLEEKARYAGFETMIRLVASSNTSSRAQTLLSNAISVFSLFDAPQGNGLKFEPSRDTKKFVTDYIMRAFPQDRNNMILNTVELATLFHFPDQSNIPTSQVERQSAKQVDGPSVLPDSGLLLGYNEFRGVKKPIFLQDDDRRRHSYIIGQTGMGKSVFLENLALQDMQRGLGFAFLDPHGDSAEKLLALVPQNRIDDVIYFNPGDYDNPIGFNILEVDPNLPEGERDRQIDFINNEIAGMLYSLYDPGHTGIVGPRMENIVRNSIWLLQSGPEGGTFMDVPKVIVDPAFAKSRLPYLKNARAIDFWTKEWPAAQRSNEAGEVSSWVVSKWAQFETTTMRNILGQLHSGIDLYDIMNNNKILIVNLSKGSLGETESKLLGMLFVMRFQAAAMQRVKIPESERKDFCLYVDEFQNFATDSFESIMSEARKFRLNLVVANQFMTQLTDKIREAIIGNMGTVICGRIGVTDAELMVKKFQPTFDTVDLQNTPNHQAVVSTLINGTPTQPFTMNLPASMGEPNDQIREYVKQLSASRYGRPRSMVESEINARLRVPKVSSGGIGQIQANAPSITGATQSKPKDSFLDGWLAKRQSLQSKPTVSPQPLQNSTPMSTQSAQQAISAPTSQNDELQRPPQPPDEISVDLRS